MLLRIVAFRSIPAKVYFLEADGDETLVRTRSQRPLRDLRSLGEVLPAFEQHGFLRVHRGHAVNLRWVQEFERRKNAEGWQVRLKPPVNIVLPISGSYAKDVWKVFE